MGDTADNGCCSKSADNGCCSCNALCLQEEDNLTLEQYQRQDEVRIRDLTAELEKLSKQVRQHWCGFFWSQAHNK